MLGALVGVDQTENPVRLVGVTGPYLLAVDQEVVTLVLGRCLQPGEVGPGIGFRIALAPADFSARDFGQKALLLLFRAIFQQRRAEHGDAEAVQGIAAVQPRHFLAEYLGFFRRQAAAAIGLRPVGHGPAARRHRVQPPLLIGRKLRLAAAPDDVLLAQHRLAHRGRAVRLQPCARLRAEYLWVAHRKSFVKSWASRAIAIAL